MASELITKDLDLDFGGLGTGVLRGLGYVQFSDNAAAPVAAAGKGRLRYNHAQTRFEQSVDGGAWTPLTGVSSAAPVNAEYWVRSSDGTLTNEIVIGNLADGIIKHASGTPARAVPGTDYVFPAGVAGGQVINGGTLSGDTLTLWASADAARGKILAGVLTVDQANSRVGLGTTTPAVQLHTTGAVRLDGLGATGLVKNTNGGNLSVAVAGTDYEVALTFQQGVTRASNVVTNDLITGKAGGQTIRGGLASGENLVVTSTLHATKGAITVGQVSINEATGAVTISGTLGIGGAPASQLHTTGTVRLDGLGSTGLVKSTHLGNLSIAVAGTDYYAPIGGTGLLKTSGGVLTIAVAGTDYEALLTFQQGVTRTGNIVRNDLITGKAGGQTVIGGTGLGESLTIQSTSHGTKGLITVGPLVVSEVNSRMAFNASNVAGRTLNYQAAGTDDRAVFTQPTATQDMFWVITSGGTTSNAAGKTALIGSWNSYYGASRTDSVTWYGLASMRGSSGFTGFLSASTPNAIVAYGSDTNHDVLFVSNELERMRLTKTGDLGIGTSSPLSKLHMATPTGTVARMIIENTGSGANDAGQIRFRNAGADHGTLTAYGPGVTLLDGFQRPNTLMLSNGLDGGVSVVAWHPSGVLRFYSGGANQRMHVAANGNVGIGTTGPSAQLHTTGTTRLDGLGGSSGLVKHNGGGNLSLAVAGVDYALPGGGGGGGGSEPLHQVVFGTGSGTTSSSAFLFNAGTTTASIGGANSAALNVTRADADTLLLASTGDRPTITFINSTSQIVELQQNSSTGLDVRGTLRVLPTVANNVAGLIVGNPTVTATSGAYLAAQIDGTFSPASGNSTFATLLVEAFVTQGASATGRASALRINLADTSFEPGACFMIEAASTSGQGQFHVDNYGNVGLGYNLPLLYEPSGNTTQFGVYQRPWSGAEATGTVPTLAKFQGANMTGVARDEIIDVLFALDRTVEMGESGNVGTMRAVVIRPPIYAAMSPMLVNTTATLAITGAPAGGAHVTVSAYNRLALWTQGGQVRIDDGGVGPFLYMNGTSGGSWPTIEFQRNGVQIATIDYSLSGSPALKITAWESNADVTISGNRFLTLDAGVRVEVGNHMLPDGNGAWDLGSATRKWNQIWAVTPNFGDLHLGFEDGEGEWILREGRDGIYAEDKRSGKRFRVRLDEVAGDAYFPPTYVPSA